MSADIEVIQQTVMKRIQDNWEDRSDPEYPPLTAIDWYGVGFRSEDCNEWIQPIILGHDQSPARRGASVESFILNINVFVREGSHSNANRAWALAEVAKNLFDQEDVVLLSGGYTIRFEEAKTSVVPVSVRDGKGADERLHQINVSITGRIITG